jgi:pyruvate, water dikinase
MSVLWFDDRSCLDVAVAGGKGASLARMTAEGLPVPPGFVVAADALQRRVDAERLRALARDGDHAGAQALVREASAPDDVASAYQRLGGLVAVRSSACAEDSEAASFAGQQETFLNVLGAAEVARHVVECWASFFSERALFYRARKGSIDDVRIAIAVQKMVEPEKAGVLFTCDPVQRRRDQMIVEAVRGLGERVVSGHVTPDHYVVDRGGRVKRAEVPNGGILAADELVLLAAVGRQLEERFGTPQDIEWALAGGKLHLLQSRPVTTL